MKKLFKILAVGLLMIAVYGCSADQNRIAECSCRKDLYKYKLVGYENGGVTPRYDFVLTYTGNPIEDFCDTDTQGNFVLIENDMYYKITCE